MKARGLNSAGKQLNSVSFELTEWGICAAIYGRCPFIIMSLFEDNFLYSEKNHETFHLTTDRRGKKSE